MTRTTGIEALLLDAYTFLSNMDMQNTVSVLNEAIKVDFENAEVLYALKCVHWWQDSMQKAANISDPLECGDYIIDRWKIFKRSNEKFKTEQPKAEQLKAEQPSTEHLRAVAAIKQFAFGSALRLYNNLANDGDSQEPDILFRLGQANKCIGNYEVAQKHLEAAVKVKRDDPKILAELADIYSLLDNQRTSKALFREAFFINPQSIDTSLIESGFIARLAEHAIQADKLSLETNEWIPIYGELLAVFSVKRELKPMEVSRLKQSVYELESEMGSDGSRRAIILPRLINRYFWLIDNYIKQKEDKSKIEELLLKIKLLDPVVYKSYIT